MIITECENCGALFNEERLSFPKIKNDDGIYIEGTFKWNGITHIPKTICPICGGDIVKTVLES